MASKTRRPAAKGTFCHHTEVSDGAPADRVVPACQTEHPTDLKTGLYACRPKMMVPIQEISWPSAMHLDIPGPCPWWSQVLGDEQVTCLDHR